MAQIPTHKAFSHALRLGSIAFCLGFTHAADITVSTYGQLGGVASLDFSGAQRSYTGTLANAGAHFSLTNGLRWGLGAIGAWTPYEQQGGISSPYTSEGDAKEAYIGYTNKLISFYAGRFQNDFMKFDWLQGNVQGLSLRFTTYEDKMIYWLTYANSYLYTGKQYNYTQGDRIASNLMNLASYYTFGEKNQQFGQGELLALGVDFTYSGFLLKPFALFHTQAGYDNALLLQGGLKAGYTAAISNLTATTILQAMYQYWDIAAPDSAASVLVWGDQSFRHHAVIFGGGVVGVLGSVNNFIYALSDSSKFYARSFLDSGRNLAPYFTGGSLYGYIFAGIDLPSMRIDGMATFGTYEEYSLMSSFPIWHQKNMKLDIGGGYGYVRNTLSSGAFNVGGSALKLFTSFSY